MSEPNDKRLEEDKGLEEYLRRESDVSQRYRQLDADDVPPQLDAAVIARARAAIEPSKRKPTWMKWGAPLALAASAVMVVAIVLEVGVQDEVRMPAPQVEQTTKAAPEPKAEVVIPEVAQEAPLASPAVPSAELRRAKETDTSKPRAEKARPDNASGEVSRQHKAVAERAIAPESAERAAAETVTVTSARPPPPSVANSATPVMVVEDSIAEAIATAAPAPGASASSSNPETVQFASQAFDAQQGSEQIPDVPAAQRSTAITRTSAPASQATAAPAAQVPRLSPEAWLERIRTLRRDGKVIEADQQWREFRESYPQFEVIQTDSARPKP